MKNELKSVAFSSDGKVELTDIVYVPGTKLRLLIPTESNSSAEIEITSLSPKSLVISMSTDTS